jgi:hypothetical protein
MQRECGAFELNSLRLHGVMHKRKESFYLYTHCLQRSAADVTSAARAHPKHQEGLVLLRWGTRTVCVRARMASFLFLMIIDNLVSASHHSLHVTRFHVPDSVNYPSMNLTECKAAKNLLYHVAVCPSSQHSLQLAQFMFPNEVISLLYRLRVIDEYEEFAGMRTGRGNRSTRTKPAPSSALSTTNPI